MSIPPLLRATLRAGLGLLIAIPALAVILIGGGLLFLRSDAGERWVERAAAEHLPAALAGSGLSLQFGRLTGPLPQALRVTDLRISDPRGVFLTVAEASVRLRLTALLSGTIAVDTLLVRDPVLHRLPELPETADLPPEQESAPFTFAQLGDTGRVVGGLLPRLRLDGVRLANARIAAEALGLPSPPSAGAASPRDSASQPPSAIPSETTRPAPDKTEQTPPGNAFLTVNLTGNGPLTDWHADLNADWPGVADLAGELFLGNTGAWLLPAGSPTSTAEPPATSTQTPAFTPDVGARVRLALWLKSDSAASPGTARPTFPAGETNGQAPAAPQKNAPGGHVPRDAAPDSGLTVTLLAGLTDAPRGTLAVPELGLRLPGMKIDGDLAAADAAVQGALTLVLDDPHALAALLRQAAGNGLPVPEIDLPLREATLGLALSGRPDAPELTLDARTRGLTALEKQIDATARLRLQAAGLMAAPVPTAASAQDAVSASAGGQSAVPQGRGQNAPGAPARPLRLDLDGTAAISGFGTGAEDTLAGSLAMRLEQAGNELSLNAFSCRIGEDLATVAAQGRFNTGDGAAALTLRAGIPALDRLPLRALLSLPEAPAGALNLEARLESAVQEPGSSLSEIFHVTIPPLTAAISLTGTGMRWGLPLLDKALGKTPALSAELRLPPRASQEADTAAARLTVTAAAVDARGEASLRATPESEPRLDAEIRLNLPALAAFDPLVPDLSGSLAATLRASGPLSSPRVELTAASPALRRAESALTDLHLALKADVPGLYRSAPDHGNAKAPRCDGTARLEALVSQAGLTSAKGEPIRLSTQWSLRPATAAEAGAFNLGQLSATAPGITLSGALGAKLPRVSENSGQAPAPRLDGHLDLDVADWALINTAAGLKGSNRIHSKTARLHVALVDGPEQGARAEVNLRGLRAPDTTVSLLQATLEAADIFGAAPRVAFTAQSGPGTAAGRSWQEGTMRVNGPLSQLVAALSLKGQVEADLGLTLDAPGGMCRIDRLRAKDGPTGLGLRLNAPLEASFRPNGAGNALHLRGLDASLLPSGSLKGDALVAPEALDVTFALKDLKLGALRPLLDVPLPDADLTADARVSRSGARFPSGTVAVRADDIRYAGSDLPPVAFRLDASLEPAAPGAGGNSRRRQGSGAGLPGLRARAVLSGVGPSDFVAEARLPLERALGPDGLPRPDLRRPLTGSAHWQGSLAPLWNFVPLADRRVTGEAKLDAVLSGTLAAPELSADLSVSQGQYEDILLGLLLTDITADLHLRSAGESRLSVSLGDGQGGTARLEGKIGPLDKGLPLAVKGVIDRLAPLHRNDLSITLSGDAGVSGPAMTPADLSVQAAITVDRGEFNLVGSFGSSIPTLDVVTVPTSDASARRTEANEAAASPAGPLLDVNVTLPGRFFVRGRGLESEWRGKLNVEGPASEPVVLGTISSVRGTLQLLGKEFALSRGNVLFTGATPPIPSLDMLLTYEGPSITAEASVSGTATSPALKLSSRPPLPEDEVVAQVLFGQSAGSLGRLEALQLANELRLLASGGPGLFGTARDALGMDVIRFKNARKTQQPAGGNAAGQLNPGQAPAADNADADEGVPTLEVGKYVMDNVYVGLEQGMTGDDSGVRVEIELTPRLSIEASTTSRGSEIGASWKKDY